MLAALVGPKPHSDLASLPMTALEKFIGDESLMTKALSRTKQQDVLNFWN